MTEKPSQVPETSKNPEIQKPMYPLNFDFATTKGAQEGVAMQNKVRMA